MAINELNEQSYKLFQDISREVNIISKLNHPSVLKFILFSPINFKCKNKPVIITEYASNGALSDILEHDINFPDQPILDQTHKLIIIYGIVSAMSYLHKHDIIHRDLKPENILIDDFLFPKVADFGLSKLISNNENVLNQTALNTIKGTPLYMSPEILSKSKYSKSSDIYAFSIIVYEIMTCEKPYQNLDIFKLYLAVQQAKRPVFNKKVPEVYKYLIERCWSHDPTSRPTFDEILNELRTNLDYITQGVNKSEYFNYIKYIDEYKATFDSKNVIVPTINLEYYQKALIHLNLTHQLLKVENSPIKVIEEYVNESKYFPFKYFKKLRYESKKLVNEADSGKIEQQFKVGQCLIEGRYDFPIDSKVGIDYLKISMNNGSKDSLIYYINLLLKGTVIPANHKKVRKLIETQLKGDIETYSLIYGKLLKKEKKYPESSEYFAQSMKTGNIESCYKYGELLRKGYIKEKYENQIDDVFKNAINKGHLKAMFKYGLYLKNIKKDEHEGNCLIKMSADKGYPKALFYYGTILENNEKESKNENNEKSIEYFKRVANEGHVESMNKYATSLLELLQISSKKLNKKDLINFLQKLVPKVVSRLCINMVI